MLVKFILVLLLFVVGTVYSQPGAPIGSENFDFNQQISFDQSFGGYRLERRPYYFITTPRRVRPGQTVIISSTILRLDPYEAITLRVSIIKGGTGFAVAEETFTQKGTRLMKMLMPHNTVPGVYYMRVEGFVGKFDSTNRGQLFIQDQPVLFYQKQVSVFIQTDKVIYNQGDRVSFRVICVKPNLMPNSGVIDIFLQDPKGFNVQRWRGKQTNLGIVEETFHISDRPQFGKWKIVVDAFGHKYDQDIEIEEFWERNLDVNVSMPPFMHSQGFALAGTVQCNFTAGVPIRGYLNLTLCVRDDPETLPVEKRPKMEVGDVNGVDACRHEESINGDPLKLNINLFRGTYDYIFTMQAISNATKLRYNEWKNKQIIVHARCYDQTIMEHREGFGITNVFESRVRLKFLGDKVRTFKPGLPFNVYVAIQSAFGSPIPLAYIEPLTFRVRGASSSYEEKIKPNADSIATFTVSPTEKDEIMTIDAYYASFQDEIITMKAKKYFSYRTNSYLQITSSTLYPRVNEYMVFQVKTTELVDEIHYQIVANGNLVTAETIPMHSTQTTFAVALSTEMAASAHIVAYYFHPMGDVIVDGMNFFVNGTASNDVFLRFNHGKDFSQHSVEVIAASEPGAMVAFQASDRELFMRSGGARMLTETDILEELATYDDHANSSFRHTWVYPNMLRRTFFFNSPTYGFDANTTFAFAGLLAFSDANVTAILHNCNWTLGMMPCYDGRCFPLSQLCDGKMDCNSGADEMGCPEKTIKRTPWLSMFSRHLRHYDSSAFLWKSSFIKAYGQTEITATLPVYPHEWMVTAFSMSPTNGLGVPTVPHLFSGVRPFYIVVQTPPKISLGEQVGVRIAIFNYWSFYLESVVRMHQSPDYDYVKVKDFGAVSSYAPGLGNGNLHTMVWLTPGMSTFIMMPCLPKRLGHVDISISVYSFYAQYSETVSVEVVPNSVQERYHTPYLADLSRQGGRNIPDFSIPVPQQFLLPDLREHQYVPGSQHAKVSLVGDIFGASIAAHPLTANNALYMPQGCAEMNMFNFAINVQSMKYLKAVQQLDFGLRRRTFNYLYQVMQRQVGYMNDDGSFSMAINDKWQRGKQTPSVWVTSFVLESLLAAIAERDWQEEFYVSGELVNKIALWLCTQQYPNGSFKELAPIYDSKLYSNRTSSSTSADGQVYDNISLTAYILIALNRFNSLTGDARGKAASARNLAVSYLERQVPRITANRDPFQVAIVAYAFHVTNSREKNTLYTALKDTKYGECKECWYWGKRKINPSNITQQDTRVYLDYFYISADHGYTIQASAYAMMVYLENGNIDGARRIMEWMENQRNSNAGFASTQDSLFALQALAQFANANPIRTLFQMNLTIEPQAEKAYYKLFTANDNFATMQYQDIFPNMTFLSLRLVVEGLGWGLVQMDTWKNVEYTFLMRQPEIKNMFGLHDFNETLRFSGFNSSHMAMNPCVNYLRGTTENPRSGMAVLEISTPTAYIAFNDTLLKFVRATNQDLIAKNRDPVVRWAEFYDNKVVFYFDYLTIDKVCVNFSLIRFWPIANTTLHHKIVLYDYYEPGKWTSSLYEAVTLYNLNICKVCGSFTCPYCLWYNAAVTVATNRFSLISLVSLSSFVLFLTSSNAFSSYSRTRFFFHDFVT